MNTHLSEKAMLRWQAGEASEPERRHVAECAECQARMQPLSDALSWFGAAARQWGAEKAAAQRTLHVVATVTHRWYRFAVAAALACVLLVATGIAMLHWQKNQNAPTQAQAPQQHEAGQQETRQQELARDNALLDAVDQDVSQEVPAALEPLSWSASNTTTRQ
jgi:hypothetical protein